MRTWSGSRASIARLGAELADQPEPLRRPGGPDDLMAGLHKLADQRPAHRSGGAGDEHLHVVSPFPRTLRRRAPAVCDTLGKMSGPGTLPALRPLVFSIAYRMLGTVTDAEDVAQEAMLRIHRGLQTGVELVNPDAYATTVATRLALDAARSARRRRETYVGTWLPEPILSDDPDPAHRLEVDEAISLALLSILQRLSPNERAVFLLRDTFGYEYAEIARILDKTEAGCRQLFSWAQRRVAAGRIRFDPSPEQRQALAMAFFAAVRSGDLARLKALLAADVTFEGDGGGKAPAIKAPLIGATTVARFLLGLQRQGDRFGGRLEPVMANGQPGARIVGPDGATLGVLCLDICDGVVVAAHNQINPEKLAHLGPVGDMAALMARGGD